MVFLKLDNDGGLLVLPRIRTFSIVKAKNKNYTYKTRRFGGENRLRHQAPGNKMHNRATRIPRWNCGIIGRPGLLYFYGT